MKCNKLLVLSISCLLMVTTSNKGFAQEPEEGSESVCEVLIPEARGLYGLCLGFCEALDAGRTIKEDDPASYPEGDEAKILEAYDAIAGIDGPRMPCITYVRSGDCPLWTNVNNGTLKEDVETLISEMDGIEIEEYDTDLWYVFKIKEPGDVSIKYVTLFGRKDDTFYPVVMHFNDPPDPRLTYFPGHNAERDTYDICKYDLEKMLSQLGE